MGLGDEIMAAGRALREGASYDRRACILDVKGRPRSHPIWAGNPILTEDPKAAALTFADGGNCRPYIDYTRTTRERWAFNLDHRPTPGRIPGVYPSPACVGRGHVVIEPNLKAQASPNKQWGWRNWQALVWTFPGVDWVQLGAHGEPSLEGVTRVRTATWREAFSILAAARAAVLPEGGLHHAAAAFQVPAVVLFGGFVPVQVTGYVGHINIGCDAPEAVGWRIPHPACDEAWDAITVREVAGAVSHLLGHSPPASQPATESRP
jgi:hypothetical protein